MLTLRESMVSSAFALQISMKHLWNHSQPGILVEPTHHQHQDYRRAGDLQQVLVLRIPPFNMGAPNTPGGTLCNRLEQSNQQSGWNIVNQQPKVRVITVIYNSS